MGIRAFTIILLGILGLTTHLVSQPTGSVSSVSDEKEILTVKPVQRYLWKISHPSIRHEAYLYGYLYQVPQDYFFLPPELDQVVKQADRLVMEVDPLTNMPDYLLRGSVPFDSTLEALLTRKEYEQILNLVRDSLTHRSLQQLAERYPPAYLARQFLCDYCLAGPLGTQKIISYEDYLRQAILLPLETLGTEWTRKSLHEKASIETQVGLLKESLADRKALCKVYRRMLVAYRKGDLDEVWLLAQSSPDLGHNGGKFIEARNEVWVPEIINLLRYEDLIVAVHAQQLPGEYGLIHQFRKRGFEVVPVF